MNFRFINYECSTTLMNYDQIETWFEVQSNSEFGQSRPNSVQISEQSGFQNYVQFKIRNQASVQYGNLLTGVPLPYRAAIGTLFRRMTASYLLDKKSEDNCKFKDLTVDGIYLFGDLEASESVEICQFSIKPDRIWSSNFQRSEFRTFSTYFSTIIVHS